MNLPKSHPRYTSLKIRSLIEQGVKDGITSLNGLIAQGRGEAFDYLLGEKTHSFAKRAIDASAALLLLANHPVISVNGNTAALVPRELVFLSKLLDAPLEINLFHSSEERIVNIQKHLIRHGALHVLIPQKNYVIPFLESDRKYVNAQGIIKADVVLVPLEDGDRTEALIANNKKVITIDLNPLSRSAQKATITIVDNIVRSMPRLVLEIKRLKALKREQLEDILGIYNNKLSLEESVASIQNILA